MRGFYMAMSVLMVAGLAACQQEQASTSKMKQPETTTVMEPTLQPEAMEATDPKTVPEPVHEITGKVSPEVEVVVVEDESVKAVEKEMRSEIPPVQPSPAKPVKPEIVEKASGDPAKGAKLAKGKCGGCHYFDKDRKKMGPTLMGIFDRAPVIDGVPFSKWDAAALDEWLTKPKAVKPKTKMSFKGISEKAKRDNIIAYLKTL